MRPADPGGEAPRPPRLTEWALRLLLPRGHRDEQLGDLAEGFAVRAASSDRPADARRWYRRQAIRSVPGALRQRWQARHDDKLEAGTRMETIGQDIRYGIRSLWNSPGFSVVSTLTLAIAIGVNTAIFSLVSVIVFADLPMQESETVALIRGTNAELGVDQGSVSPADYLDLAERTTSFSGLGALTESQLILTGSDRPMRVDGLQVTGGMFEVWRLPPVLGRGIAEGEDRFGAPPVAMLSHSFWETQYGSRPNVLGETIRLDGIEHTIVGVAAKKLEFASFDGIEVVTPLIINRGEPNRASRYLFVSGRLAPGVTQDVATADLRRIGEQLASEYPSYNRGWGLWSAPVMESLIDEDGNRILLLLQLTVGMVILIACANVANMLLARATARAREIAVRSALGAERGRLIRQLLTESLMISVAAGGLGIGFAILLNEALIRISAGTEEVFLMAEFDTKVLAFTLLVSLVAPLVFGLLPALRASATDPQGALRDGRSGDGGRAGKRARSALVTAQVSLALTLMIVASLLTRTVINMHSRPLGFDPTDLLTADIALPDAGYEEEEARRIFFAEARQAVASAIGSPTTELTNTIPGAGFGARRSFVVEGREQIEGRAAPTAQVVTATDGYFDLLGLPIESGRGLRASDGAESFGVAVVSRAIADRYWPDADPTGGRIQIAGEDEWLQVVGVVADVRSPNSSETGAPYVYRPHQQDPRARMFVIGRPTQDAATLAGPIREAVWSLDPDLPVGAIQSVERAQYETAAGDYALLTLFVTFAFFSLVMSAIGIYGVMAYSVSQRRNEIGLRMALGAERRDVRLMVLGQGVRLLAAGVVIGLVAAFGVSRLLGSLVFGISPTDPLTFVGVPLLLIAVAVVANLVPALRATRLDPATTLRAE